MSEIDAAKERDATETASALHRFNRYEIKYLMEESRLPLLRERIQKRMQEDSHQVNHGPSLITSLYYDSSDLRCYFEKIEGLRFRRKLRIRVYGEPDNINDASTVYVEIKQRVNRVTQKRRIPLSYADARKLCDERIDPQDPNVRPAFIEEVLNFAQVYDLQPSAITTYHREAYVGVDADMGVRVTMDHHVRGRDRDFYLGMKTENNFIIPPHLSIVELKANERVPAWFTDLAAELNLSTVRISKYCQAIESYEIGSRAPLHARKFPKPLKDSND